MSKTNSSRDLEGIAESITVQDRPWPEARAALRVYVREADITASVYRWTEDDEGRPAGELTVLVSCIVSDLGHGSAVLGRHGEELDPDGAIHDEEIVTEGMTEAEAREALRTLLAELAAGFKAEASCLCALAQGLAKVHV